MQDCIFCKIISGEIPAKKVKEDQLILVIEDINPKAPVHYLLLPKKHIPTLMEVEAGDKEILSDIILAAQNLAVEKGFEESGFRLVVNCKEGAGQAVFHLHIHLLAGRQLHWPPG
jgi:diadenosine tetraphosphate (Ap4A) HIT family hydrolase